MIKIRASALSSFTDCMRRSFAKMYPEYIKGLGYELNDTERGIGSAVGTGVHSGVSHALKLKREDSVIGKNDMSEYGIEGFRKAIENGVIFDDTSPNLNTSEKQIVKILDIYRNERLPKIQPKEIELDLKAVDKPHEYTLTGHPDCIEEDAVRDVKTEAKSRPHHLQLGAYLLLTKANKIGKPKKLIIDWFPRKRLEKIGLEIPVPIEYDVEICEQECINMLKIISHAVNNFKDTQDFMYLPTNNWSNLCSRKYCTAWGTDFCKITKR